MRRTLVPIAVIAAVAVGAAAAYLGLQSGRAENQPPVPPPPRRWR